MIILDTNIISEYAKPHPSKTASDWLRVQNFNGLASCAPVISELWFGARQTAIRHGTQKYQVSFEKFLNEVIDHKVFPFDIHAAIACGHMRAQFQSTGQTLPIVDAMIAAICIANGATLATRNTKDFDGLDVRLINPFETGGKN